MLIIKSDFNFKPLSKQKIYYKLMWKYDVNIEDNSLNEEDDPALATEEYPVGAPCFNFNVSVRFPQSDLNDVKKAILKAVQRSEKVS